MPDKWIQDNFHGGILNDSVWNFVFMGSPGSQIYNMSDQGGICLMEAARHYAGACGILSRASLEKSMCSIAAIIDKFDFGAAVALYDGTGGWNHYLQLTLLQGRIEVRIPGGGTINDSFTHGAKNYYVLFRVEGNFTYPCKLELRRVSDQYTVLYNDVELGSFAYAGIQDNARAIVKSIRDPHPVPDVPVSHTYVSSVTLRGIADTGSIEGTVVDSSGMGIKNAKIHIAGYDYHLSSKTDVNGHFRMDGLPLGDSTLIAAAEGYLFTSQKVTVRAEKALACRFTLEKETQLNIPRHEYNRPDFDRSGNWENLNGTWEFEFDQDDIGEKKQWYLPDNHDFGMLLQVPFSWSSLQAHGEGFLADNNSGLESNPYYSNYQITGETGWYRRKFIVPESFAKQSVILKIGASNAFTKVWCDGKFAGMSTDNYGQIEFDLGYLEPASLHQLVIRVQFPYDINSINLGKQHWWFTQCPGIWQTVWLEPRGEIYLDGVKADYTVDFSSEGEANALVSLQVNASSCISNRVWSAQATEIAAADPQNRTYEFAFESETAGCHLVDFAYAAADGECLSKLSVNGKVITDQFEWTGTLGWDTWEHARILVNLQKGENRLEVQMYDGALGKHGIVFQSMERSDVLNPLQAIANIYKPDHSLLGTYDLTLTPTEGEVALTGNRTIKIDKPELWDVFNPRLYAVRVELFNSDKKSVADSAGTYFGLRKIESKWAPEHSPSECADVHNQYQYFYLNNRPFYMTGILDQGYNPWGIYTYRSYESPLKGSIQYDINQARECGYNTLRMHIKENEPLWYYYCDQVGMLVWTEHPANVHAVPENSRWDSMYRRELRSMIQRNHCHPSIIIYSSINESWGIQGKECSSPWDLKSRQNWQRDMALLCKKLDGNRLVCDNSGFRKSDAGEINDFHSYPACYELARTEWNTIAEKVYPGSTYNYYNQNNGADNEGCDTQSGSVALISEFIHTDSMDQQMRLYPKFGGYVRMNIASYQGEDYSPMTADRIVRQQGFLKPDFSDAGYSMINRPDIILLDSSRHARAAAGSEYSVDVYVSHFGTADLNHCSYEWKLTGVDLFGNRVDVESLQGMQHLNIAEFTVKKAGTIRFCVPEDIAGGYLFVELKNGGGTVSTNYICLDISGGKTLRETDRATVFSASLSDALNSHWDAFSGRYGKQERSIAWGKNNGFYEYNFLPVNPTKGTYTKGRLIFEAASCECISGINVTDEVCYPTKVTALLNGREIGTADIEDDPFDERALFTFTAFGGEPFSHFNMGQFGYGYLISIELNSEILQKINDCSAQQNGLTIRFEASGGGMTLYGYHTGRYGIDPMLVLE